MVSLLSTRAVCKGTPLSGSVEGLIRSSILSLAFLFWLKKKTNKVGWVKYLWDIDLPHQLSLNWLTGSKAFGRTDTWTYTSSESFPVLWVNRNDLSVRPEEESKNYIRLLAPSRSHSTCVNNGPAQKAIVSDIPQTPTVAVNPDLGRPRLLLSFISAPVPWFLPTTLSFE